MKELTDRESEALVRVVRGLSHTDIARHLTVSEHTVKAHLSRAFTKFQLSDRVQAVILACEMGAGEPLSLTTHRLIQGGE